jgi:N-acetylglucosamine kinase-like BadF-type ATPase
MALVGATSGVVVVAGTGARVYGCARSGIELSLDGLGPLLGDWGGGYQIGLAGLRAAARALQHPRHATSLKAAIFDSQAWMPAVWRRERRDAGTTAARRRAVLRAISPEHVETRRLGHLIAFCLYPHDRSVIAALAAVVDAEARAGDGVARRILHGAARDMSDSVWNVVQRLDMAHDDCVLVGTGSVSMRSDVYWRELCRRVTAFAPRFRPIRSPLPPVAGVALAGMARLNGGDVSAARRRLFEQLGD